MSYWYVDSTASGLNNGTSWSNAWRSFSAISWSSVLPSDTIYISGGSSSKTYYELLTIGRSGAAGASVKIDVGANSPNPSGHNGIVTIDGSGSRSFGIYANAKNYIDINGWADSTYKMKLQNCAGSDSEGLLTIEYCNYFNADYIEMVNATQRGAYWKQYNTYSRLRGCYIHTGTVNNSWQTDGIYAQFGHDNVFEYNRVVLTQSGDDHNDCFQSSNNEYNCTIRNNWLEHSPGTGSSASQGIIIGILTGGWTKIYNNVVIGPYNQPWQVLIVKSDCTGLSYIWSNLIIAQHSTSPAIQMACADSAIGEIKNNILVNNNGTTLLFSGGAPTASKIDYNCLWRKTGTTVCSHTIGTHNLMDVDPRYDVSDEYRPLSDSPCIGVGANLSAHFTVDIDGNPRSAWDIGPYEYGSYIPPEPEPNVVVSSKKYFIFF